MTSEAEAIATLLHLSVLVVDDEEGILSALRSLLRRDGHALHLFTSAVRALAFLRVQSVDIILSDLRMPEMSGIEFLRKAGDLCPRAVRIMLSGYEDKDVIVQSIAGAVAQHYVMKPWDDDELRQLMGLKSTQFKVMNLERLRVIYGGTESLPAPPQLHVNVSAILARQEAPLRALVAEIEKDPPVVAKLLQVANSIYYGSRQPVTTVREAVQFVGTEYIGSLILAIEAFQSLGQCPNAWARSVVDQLWQSAVTRAAVAKQLAERWPDFDGRPAVYVASLFQDLGYVIRVCTQPEQFREFMSPVEPPGQRFLEREARLFGMTHDEVGATLLRHWNLPESIAGAVARHHRNGPPDDMATILQIADAINGGPFVDEPGGAIGGLAAEWRTKLGIRGVTIEGGGEKP